MLILKLALQAWIVPALVCLAVFWVLGKLTAQGGRFRLASAISLASGYLAGHLLSIGLPPFPPVETTQWLFVLACLAVLPALVEVNQVLRWVLVGITGAALLAVTLAPMYRHHWGLIEAIVWSAGLLGLLALAWHWLDSLAVQENSSALLLPTALAVSLGASALLALSATTLLAQLAAAMAAGLLVLTLLSWRHRVSSAGWLPVALTLLSGLCLNGYFYARLSSSSVVCIAFALLSVGMSRTAWLRRRSGWKRVAITLVATISILAIAVTLAALDFLAATAYDDY